ncbi:MAG: type II toxin-antitoxin system VapC family toxin [Armatimonadetes bacterium]|nr:type II toxin-antitoxin system VapC family toxin [Armatimonadota bacterium]
MFTLDASVHVNALNPAEHGSPESQQLLAQLEALRCPIFVPTLLLVEISGAVTRSTDDAAQGMGGAQRVRNTAGYTWVPLDDFLTQETVRMAATRRLRGADAVYAAVAKRYDCKLVTRDQQQLDRLKGAVTCLTPEEALAQLSSPAHPATGAQENDSHAPAPTEAQPQCTAQ